MCDAYSFGVILMEVLTGQNPLEMLIRHMNLVDDFVCQWKRIVYCKLLTMWC